MTEEDILDHLENRNRRSFVAWLLIESALIGVARFCVWACGGFQRLRRR